jgi:hypothetical protein
MAARQQEQHNTHLQQQAAAAPHMLQPRQVCAGTADSVATVCKCLNAWIMIAMQLHVPGMAGSCVLQASLQQTDSSEHDRFTSSTGGDCMYLVRAKHLQHW